MKTKGALVWELNQPWSVEEIGIGAPRRGEVTVQLETAGLCHSDHHLLTGDFPIPSFPVLGGHVGRCEGREVESWMGLTANGGVCVLTSMGSVMATDVTLNLAGLSLLQKSLQGSLFGGGNPQCDIPEILPLYRLGHLELDDMVTREYALEQINEGYRDMLEGRNIRGVIRYTDADRA